VRQCLCLIPANRRRCRRLLSRPPVPPAPLPVGRIAAVWHRMGWKSKLLTGCAAYMAFALLVVPLVALSGHSPPSVKSDSTARSSDPPPEKTLGAEASVIAKTSRDGVPAKSQGKALTKAQKEQIRLRLQSFYGALYSLPTVVPANELPNVMQQRANLTA
jgi:hypothetical protein